MPQKMHAGQQITVQLLHRLRGPYGQAKYGHNCPLAADICWSSLKAYVGRSGHIFEYGDVLHESIAIAIHALCRRVMAGQDSGAGMDR